MADEISRHGRRDRGHGCDAGADAAEHAEDGEELPVGRDEAGRKDREGGRGDAEGEDRAGAEPVQEVAAAGRGERHHSQQDRRTACSQRPRPAGVDLPQGRHQADRGPNREDERHDREAKPMTTPPRRSPARFREIPSRPNPLGAILAGRSHRVERDRRPASRRALPGHGDAHQERARERIAEAQQRDGLPPKYRRRSSSPG